jgi:hypothetical protein
MTLMRTEMLAARHQMIAMIDEAIRQRMHNEFQIST